ncbi:MAG: flagellar basal-body MS-ring/collar protein FliF [Syntrophales bacterium]|nr:flagellar basal-body MS-ring/collar protein FliF [Syntrophales bacterium]
MNPNWKRLVEGFLALPPGRKLTVVGVIAVTILSIGAMVYFTNLVDYGVLFSNLTNEDAAAISAKLKEKKIPFQVSPDGKTISVPIDKVPELRLELASSGLPHGGGVGFEIFDHKTIGVTEFEQQINYRRALQGELSRTINSLDEIESSRVHIALPKESVFVEREKKATASVTVKLKPGRSLKPQQVDGIVHLVASSVEGLNPQDVMVVDSRGNVLSRIPPDPKSPTALTGSQAEYQKNLEREMANRIQAMLENVVGKGKVSVQVAADLDFRVTEKTEEIYDAENPVIRSVQKGTDRSVTKAGDAKSGAGGTEKEKVDETTNYEINKTVSRTVMPVGEIRKLSIAVLVDGVYVKNEKGEMTFQERPKKELEMLEEVVRKSAGFNPQRGDQVVVSCLPFQKAEVGEMVAPTWGDRLLPLLPVLKYLLVVGLALAAFFIIIKPMTKYVAAQAPAPAMPAPGTTVSVTVGPEGQVAEKEALPSADLLELLQSSHQLTEAELTKKLAEADAKKFAELLRNWLT